LEQEERRAQQPIASDGSGEAWKRHGKLNRL